MCNLFTFAASYFNMLLRIFESPIVDVLLIMLAIRFIWPGLFGIKKRKPSQNSSPHQQSYVKSPPTEKTTKASDGKGEYIDYEEIK